MNTPICDFVRRYAGSDALRLHMPGHKGTDFLGIERLDITEIDGADSLYEASGIIRESETNATALFGCDTYYSTEGSSQCIRAMLYLAALHARQRGRRPLIAAARNVHKTFLSAVGLLDLDVLWLYSREPDSYLSCKVDAAVVEEAMAQNPTAVYLTSPDYLGNVADISAIADVCHRHGVLLLVDNAHGAYLKFLEPSRHPADLGADLCCDSAHKTLPVLTGGAYLHVTDKELSAQAKNALALFGSTSPSYLILQSLDQANAYLAGDYPRRLSALAAELEALRGRLRNHGYVLAGNEPLKLTICAKPYGFQGRELAEILQEANIVAEFSDPDYVVLMLTPETESAGLERLAQGLLAVPKGAPVRQSPPVFHSCERVMSIRQAILSPSQNVPVAESKGKILATATVGCPPAVPIVICGERIDESALRCFDYYGIESCGVVKE